MEACKTIIKSYGRGRYSPAGKPAHKRYPERSPFLGGTYKPLEASGNHEKVLQAPAGPPLSGFFYSPSAMINIMPSDQWNLGSSEAAMRLLNLPTGHFGDEF